MLYYANGGPGPADKLLRVHAPADGEFAAWRLAPAREVDPLRRLDARTQRAVRHSAPRRVLHG